MKPILRTLKKLGFEDVRAGVTNTHNNTSGIEPDIVTLHGLPYFPCHVFAVDTAVDKTFANSSSVKAQGADNEWLREIRSEINQIVEQYSNAEQTTTKHCLTDGLGL